MRAPSAVRAHAHHDVVAEAENWRARNGLDAALARRGGLRRPCIDDVPLALGDHLEHGVVGFLRRRIGEVGLDVRIGGALLLRRVQAGIGDRIGVARPQSRDRFEARRVDRVGGDVIDGRQAVRLDAEIERIGNQRDADEQRRDRLANPADPFPPDGDPGGEGEQDRDQGEHQRAGQRRQRRHDVERG